jgi:hypothetical protein
MRVRFLSSLALSVALAASAIGPVTAKPTPVPGGANQTRAVAGGLHATLFNGQVRLRKMMLTKPDNSTSESYPDTPDTKWLVFRALASNGMPKVLEMSQFSASLVDGDGVAVAAQPDKVRPVGMVSNIPPGGAWKETILFNVPRDFKPVKIVLVSADKHYPSFRITIAASDLPS